MIAQWAMGNLYTWKLLGSLGSAVHCLMLPHVVMTVLHSFAEQLICFSMMQDLECSCDICCHRDVSTDIEMSSLFNNLLHNYFCILLKQVLYVSL